MRSNIQEAFFHASAKTDGQNRQHYHWRHQPIAVQTMLNVPVKDIAGNVEQAKRVAKAGCQIVRVTVPTPADAAVVSAIKEAVDIPVVADIHFDYRAALAAIDAGADKIRINPGNIGDDDRVKAVADACNAKNIPIRIGVNGGSLEKHILARYGAPVPEAWWKVPCTMCACWKSMTLIISSSP